MGKHAKLKCLHCGQRFEPDFRNRYHQKYCSQPLCRKASKAAAHTLPDDHLERDPPGLANCHLSRWFETVGEGQLGHSQELLRIKQLHAQLHLVARNILLLSALSPTAEEVNAILFFQELWQEMSTCLKRIGQ